MIKIEKNILDIPSSIQLPLEHLFVGNVPRASQTTHARRLELIEKVEYIDEDTYNSRYKIIDTKKALAEIYKNKCAYCEQKIEQSHVEHYRPKKIYYWLAYSWDNLILSCSKCNQYKGINFNIKGTKAIYLDNQENLEKIHINAHEINKSELPLMVNPETTDPSGNIYFERNGLIKSDNERFVYTIDKCKIDRDYLNDARRDIIKDFERKIISILNDKKSTDDKKSLIQYTVHNFVADSKIIEKEFLAFRRYAIRWLGDIIKEKNNL